jgi:hypothetical protein
VPPSTHRGNREKVVAQASSLCGFELPSSILRRCAGRLDAARDPRFAHPVFIVLRLIRAALTTRGVRQGRLKIGRPFAGNGTPASASRLRRRIVGWLLIGACVAVRAGAIDVDTPAGRWQAGGYAEGLGVVKTDADSPGQRPEGVLDLTVTGDPHRRVRTHLETQMLFGGPPKNTDGFGAFNFRDVFQNRSPSLEFEEGYVEVSLPRADVRAGLQKFAWGRLDTFHPTDVLNPREYHDPFLTNETESKIGLPSLSASLYPPEPSWADIATPAFAIIWVPVPVPFRFPLQDERWFPPAASVPPVLDIPAGTLRPGLPGAVIHTDFSTANAGAGQRLENGAVGARLSGLSHGVDWSLSFYDGRETAPAFALQTAVRLATPSAGTGALPLDATAVLQPRFGRIWMTGADAAFQLAGVTARAEAVYGSGRLVPRSTAELLGLDNIVRVVGPSADTILAQLLAGQTVPIDLGNLFERRDVIEWGLGADYPYQGWTPVLQVNQSVVLNNDVTLLVPNVDTRLFGALRKAFLSDRLATEIIAVQGLERSYTLAIARATYALTDWLRVRLGYLAIGGSRNTVLGEYKRNDEVFFEVRLSQ